MKKLLFSILVSVITMSAFAQSKFAKITGPEKDLAVEQAQIHPDQVSSYSGESVIGQKFFDNTIIGTTWYDLQSYTNVMQRIWAYPDGTIGATWMSAGEGLVPERGAGYNYFDGNAWGTANPHVGPADRMGWPSYAPWGPNGEIIALYRYVVGSGSIKFYKRENKGQGDWIETTLNPPTGISLVWHSMMTSGENHEFIHLLAYTYDAEYQGQANALLYYRSSDGAQTWEVDGEVIDGSGSDYFPTIHSLTYSWANPVGETIAFTLGFDEWGGRIFKSHDNGDNWEFIQVMETPLDPFNIPTDSEVIPCGSGTSSCVLDSQGNVHVVFPRMAKVYTGGTLYYYPFTDGLIYWNESMPVIDTTLISSYTLDYLDAAGNLCGWVLTTQPSYTIPDGQPNYSNSMCAYPQLSIDAENKIFVASSTLAPDYSNGELLYRHIIANSSFDLGNNWEGQIDLNEDLQYIFSECAYPVMAPVIGDYVHIVFQEDPIPGIYEWLANHDPVENHIMYMVLDKDVFVGLKEPAEALPFEVSIYPNPVSQIATFDYNLPEGETIATITITDLAGKTVEVLQVNGQQGQKLWDTRQVKAGVYFFTLKTAGYLKTGKIVLCK